MNRNQRKKRKEKEQRKIVYSISEDSLERINKKFIQNFNYSYWYHKINALYEYIEKPEKIKTEIKYPHDITLDETIIENFKLDIHMSVFHSAETLFLVLFGFMYEPNSVSVWISRCSNTKLWELIKQLSENGLDHFIKNSEEFLRSLIYPAIDEKHELLEDSKLSVKFVKNYLKRLAKEYVDHLEYNSFKHGLRCNSGQSRFQFRDDKTQTILLDSSSDTIHFLELNPIRKNKEMIYEIKEASKTYDVKRDADIIIFTFQILHNIFEYRQSVIKKEITESNCRIKFLPYLYKTDEAQKIFDFKQGNSIGGFITRFSYMSS